MHHVPRLGTALDASLNFEAHPSNRDASAVGKPVFFFAFGQSGIHLAGGFCQDHPRDRLVVLSNWGYTMLYPKVIIQL